MVNPRTGSAAFVGPSNAMFGSMFGLASSRIPTTSCPGDFDGSGQRTLDDLFSFLFYWFSEDAEADIDGSGVTDIGDVFAFLQDWLGEACV